MPSISAVGNIRPVSTTTMRPSYSTTVMFLPISPNPPSGSTRSFGALIRSVHRDADRVERLAHDDALICVELEQGQSQAAVRDQPGHLQRCLEWNRVGDEAEN